MSVPTIPAEVGSERTLASMIRFAEVMPRKKIMRTLCAILNFPIV